MSHMQQTCYIALDLSSVLFSCYLIDFLTILSYQEMFLVINW